MASGLTVSITVNGKIDYAKLTFTEKDGESSLEDVARQFNRNKTDHQQSSILVKIKVNIKEADTIYQTYHIHIVEQNDKYAYTRGKRKTPLLPETQIAFDAFISALNNSHKQVPKNAGTDTEPVAVAHSITKYNTKAVSAPVLTLSPDKASVHSISVPPKKDKVNAVDTVFKVSASKASSVVNYEDASLAVEKTETSGEQPNINYFELLQHARVMKSEYRQCQLEEFTTVLENNKQWLNRFITHQGIAEITEQFMSAIHTERVLRSLPPPSPFQPSTDSDDFDYQSAFEHAKGIYGSAFRENANFELFCQVLKEEYAWKDNFAIKRNCTQYKSDIEVRMQVLKNRSSTS